MPAELDVAARIAPRRWKLEFERDISYYHLYFCRVRLLTGCAVQMGFDLCQCGLVQK
jgi:hypothetical protein